MRVDWSIHQSRKAKEISQGEVDEMAEGACRRAWKLVPVEEVEVSTNWPSL